MRRLIIMTCIGFLAIPFPKTLALEAVRAQTELQQISLPQRVRERLEQRKSQSRTPISEANIQRRRILREQRKARLRARALRRSRLESQRAERQRVIDQTSLSLEQLRHTMLETVNHEREQVGIPPLTSNALLDVSAQAYAEDMLKRDFFGHESPEGESLKERVHRAGYGNLTLQNCNCHRATTFFGENLAKGQPTVAWAMDDWMHSPDHRENILNPAFKELGVGIAGTLWVQHFGTITIVPK